MKKDNASRPIHISSRKVLNELINPNPSKQFSSTDPCDDRNKKKITTSTPSAPHSKDPPRGSKIQGGRSQHFDDDRVIEVKETQEKEPMALNRNIVRNQPSYKSVTESKQYHSAGPSSRFPFSQVPRRSFPVRQSNYLSQPIRFNNKNFVDYSSPPF